MSAVKHSLRQDLTEEERSHGEPMNFMKLAQQILGFYLLFLVIYLSSKAQGPELLALYPILPALLFAFVYSHNTICIQVAHVTKQSYNPWTKIALFNLLVHLLNIALGALQV